MKKILLILTISLSYNIIAQDNKFVFQQKENHNIHDLADSNNVFFDYDLDGDLDLIISGYNKTLAEDSNTHTFLYTNDGKGNFTLDKRSTFMRIEYGKIDVADIDQDNDLDIVITGQELNRTKENGVVIYKNEKGIFKKHQKISGENYCVYAGFLNVNKDKYADLLIERNEKIEYYINDKKGNFSLKGDLKGAGSVYEYGVVAFDMDNDGDDEVLLQGDELAYKGDKPYLKKNNLFFKNLSKGYTSISHVFKNTDQGIIHPVDINNDGNMDVFMTNIAENSEAVFEKSLFYFNTGKTFKTVENDILKYNLGVSCFVDLDNDGDKDLIISGGRKALDSSAYYEDAIDIYEHKNGKFILLKRQAFPYAGQGSILTGDIDGD